MIPVIAAGLLMVAAYSDVRRRRIPNVLVLIVAALGMVRLASAADAGLALYTAAAGAAVFAGGLLLFWRGLIGGGDVKLMSAVVLLVGHHALVGFLLAMSFCGLVVTLAMLAAGRLLPRAAALPLAGMPAGEAMRPTVPYGVAIAAAGILVLLLQSPIPG